MDPRERQFTVARVRAGDRDIEVMFFESARIYTLSHDNPAFAAALGELRAAAATGGQVRVRLAEPHGDVIEGVAATGR